jgi:NADH:ubiquinone oxidoreductase subunit H
MCRESAVDCAFGNVHSSLYEKVEATWGSLVANWGVFFCFVYVFWALSHLVKARKIPLDISTSDPDLIFWSIVLYTGFFFCILNTVPYKYPVNILWYASLAYIQAYALKEKTKLYNS